MLDREIVSARQSFVGAKSGQRAQYVAHLQREHEQPVMGGRHQPRQQHRPPQADQACNRRGGQIQSECMRKRLTAKQTLGWPTHPIRSAEASKSSRPAQPAGTLGQRYGQIELDAIQ